MTEQRETAVHIVAKGRVQGVGFRFFTRDVAICYGLTGWVRNLPSGDVEAEAEGSLPAIEKWLEDLRVGPSMSRVDSFQVDWRPFTGGYTNFEIR